MNDQKSVSCLWNWH